MKKRNPLAVAFFSIITLGIYDIYWLLKTKNILNKETQVHVPSIWLIIAPLLLSIVSFIAFVGYSANTNINSNGSYNYSYNNFNGSSTSSSNFSGSSTASVGKNKTNFAPVLILTAVFIILAIILFFLSAYWLYRYSQAVDSYTNGRMSTALAFLVLFLVHIIGVALVQDAFNKKLGNPTAGSN